MMVRTSQTPGKPLGASDVTGVNVLPKYINGRGSLERSLQAMPVA